MSLSEMRQRKAYLLETIKQDIDTADTWIELDALNYAIWNEKNKFNRGIIPTRARPKP